MSTRNAVRLGAVVWGCAVLAIVLGGCTPAITVVSTVPANGATGVPINTSISATFSAAVDPASITDTTFTLTKGGVVVPGAVSYDAATRTATLVPAADLASSALYTAKIGARAEKSMTKCLECYWPLVVVPAVIGAVLGFFVPDDLVEHEWVFTTALPIFKVDYVASPPAGGTVTGPPIIIAGGTAPVIVTPSPGWSIGSVTTSNGLIAPAVKSASAYTLSDVTADATVTATFTPNVFALAYAALPEDAGTVTGPPTIATGESVEFNVTTNSCWAMTSLTTTSGTIAGTGPYTLSGVTADATIIATFAEITYPVTYVAVPPEGGTISGPPNISDCGSIEVAAAANQDWSLSVVTVSSGDLTTSPPYTLSNVHVPVTLTAYFLEIPRKK